MDFKENVDFVYKFKDWERGDKYKFGLSTFVKFLEKVGSPQKELKRVILIAGTKGKGSTANMVASILRKSGKTGLFTSPHLVDIRERIRINEGLIPASNFSDILDELKPHINDRLSTFELLAAISFIYFLRERTDFSVFEVGLGGRLDATNVTGPEVSVLTTMSLDHIEILGNTLSDIAIEKCGIIREQANVVSSPQDAEAMCVIKKVCQEKEAKLSVVGEDIFCSNLRCGIDGSRFKIGRDEYFIPLLGRHQVINSLVAICTAQLLGIPKFFIKQGLKEAKLSGRLEVVRRKPTVVYDIAHNVASTWVLRRALSELFNYRHLIVIFGVLRDKDAAGMIKVLAEITDYAYVVPVRSERSEDSNKLFELFKGEGVKTKEMDSAEEAIRVAIDKAETNDLIVATGSSYIVGELLSKDV